jgi:hypothetical protein
MKKQINIKKEKQPQNLRVGGCWCLIDKMSEGQENFSKICDRYFANGI